MTTGDAPPGALRRVTSLPGEVVLQVMKPLVIGFLGVSAAYLWISARLIRWRQ